MTLVPKLPPGRANRKALQYAVDIHRLRQDGYTFSAIRLALLDAGISVSLTTIKREARRGASTLPAPRVVVVQRAVSVTPADSAAGHATTAPGHVAGGARSGREIAEAFFNANPSNPLLRAKENP